MTGLAPFLKELTGSEDLGEASKIGELKRVTQLPFARDLLKNWMAVSVASLTGRQQAKLDAMTKAVRIMPEGLSFLTYGQTLRTAGRLDEAEEMLRKAAVGQGVFNVRQRALYELIDLRLERQRTSGGKLDEAERRRLVADLRRMVALRPLPPEIADSSAAMFVMLGEPMLALQLIEDRSRRAEPSMETLHLRVMAEFELQAFPRVLATCQAILRRAPNDRLATDMRRMTQEAIKKLQGGGT
jgi:hypothetical protein